MAQIIKHRRGSLESVSGATKRAGELLVITGSSGISATNGDSILFVGIDGSTATPANKVLLGTSVPDLSGASYDTSVDGIPFYDTSAEKMYILQKGGNVEIKATANTGGTGIVSGSSQIIAYTNASGVGLISGSGQVTIGDTSGFGAFSSSLKASDDAQDARLDDLEAFSSSLDGGFVSEAELAAATGALESADTAQKARLSSLEAYSSSNDSAQSAQDARLSALEVETGSIASEQATQDGRLDSLESFESGIDSTIKAKLDAETVISGSSQVQLGSVTGFTAYSSSVDSRTAALEAAVGEGSNIDGRLSSLELTSASHDGRLDQLEADSGSQALRLDDLETFQSDIETAISVNGQDVVVNGNFTVSGTQTVVDSTTVQIGDNIIELNGSGAANGGLYVADATSPNLATGSLLWDSTNDQWVAGPKGSESKILVAGGDSVISGSSQVNADSITNFDANVLDKMNVEGVISGSSQVVLAGVTGFSSYSTSVNDAQNAQDARLSSLEAETGSIESEQAAQDSRLNQLSAATASIASAQGVQDGRLDSIESYTASLDATFEAKASASHTLVSGSSQIVSFLDSENVNLGGISGSSLNITGNAKIDGNLTLGGNITIGDASGDTISFGGEISSDMIPSVNNSYDLGSASKKLAEVHATNLFGTVNGVVNASNGVISGSSQLDGEAIDSALLTSVEASGSFSGSFQGSFVGDGSQLTGLVTDLRISGSTGNDVVSLLSDDLTFAGGTAISVAVSDNTITINADNASTSAKGIASFDADDFSVSSGNVSIKAGGVRATNLNADVAGTGIALNGVDNSLEVSYGSTAGTAVEGNTSLTVQGTANEIEISGGSVTLGAGGTVTIGLPDDVTIGNDLFVNNDLQVSSNLTVIGNLSVLGTTTTIDSTTVSIGDNVIELNYGGAQATAGLLVTDATAPNTVSGSLLWDGTNDLWKGGALGSEKEFARLDSAPSVNTVLKADANGLLVDSVLSDDGTDATFSGDVIVSGLAASAFLYSDGSKTLAAVTPSNAGDMIQWNGSSFVASNEIDGGTF